MNTRGHRTCTALLILMGAVAIGLVACASPEGSSSAAKRPNVLLIVADDLGYSDIGAFGGEIPTPNLDALARGGRLMTNFHVGATCSPTRSMLLSGADHHRVGLGSMAEATGYNITRNQAPWGASNTYSFGNVPEGYAGHLNSKALSMAQLLHDAGYHTYMAGKWHLAYEVAAPDERSRTFFRLKPDALPHARGFEKSFALVNGGAAHFAPPPQPTPLDLATYAEDGRVMPASQLPADYFSTAYFTDKLIAYIDSQRSDGKPFFAYAAYTAPHWPLQAPQPEIEAQRGRYDIGYNAIRERRLERMKQLGLISPQMRPHPGMPSVAEGGTGAKRWHELSAEEKAREARLMEIYAAMVSNLDRHIGRLIAHLRKTGEYDNTLIVFMSDNGADPSTTIGMPQPDTRIDNSLANLGRPGSQLGYGPRWAEVSSTPLRLFKGFAGAEGATSSPLIVKLPRQQGSRPASDLRVHVTDVLPTVLSAAGVPVPGVVYKGRQVHSIEGVSLLGGLESEGALFVAGIQDRVLAGELFASGYVTQGPWKLSQTAAPQSTPMGRMDIPWRLYRIDQDRGETRDVASEHPETVRQLRAEWDRYVMRAGVIQDSKGR